MLHQPISLYTSDMHLTANSLVATDENTPQPLTEFTLFPKLPAELRFQIWAFIAPPRVIKIRSVAGVRLASNQCLDYDFYADESDGIRIDCNVPIILSINQESRREGLKIYQLGLGIVSSSIRSYINYKADFIQISGFCYPTGHEHLLHVFARLLTDKDSHKIHHLVVSEGVFWGRDGRCFAQLFRRSFSSLSELVLLDEGTHKVQKGLVWKEFCTAFDAEKLYFPHWNIPAIKCLGPEELEPFLVAQKLRKH